MSNFYIYEKQYEDRSHWVTKAQLDKPLCEIFEGTKTSGTAREYVIIAERILDKEHVNLESMEYEEMNRYIDSLDRLIQEMV